MSRRHERARRDHDDAADPDARVIRHAGYTCVVVEPPRGMTWREKLAALDAATEAAMHEEHVERVRLEDLLYDG